MKNYIIYLLISIFLFGCAHMSKRALTPMFEKKYPLIIGVLDPPDNTEVEINSLLVEVLSNSRLSSGVLNEPFDKEIVDVIVSVKDISIRKSKTGFIPKNLVIEGNLTIDFHDTSNNVIGSYSVEGKRERNSMNPFSSDYEDDFLLAELISDALDNFADDIEEKAVSQTHIKKMEDKIGKSEVALFYPTLTDFRRKELQAFASIRGTIPPNTVEISLSKEDKEPFITEEFFFKGLENINNQKEWSYSIDIGKNVLPLDKNIEYKIFSADVMGNKNTIERGEFRTISKSLFKLKQAEVITQGAIITTFGGLAVIMLLYSL